MGRFAFDCVFRIIGPDRQRAWQFQQVVELKIRMILEASRECCSLASSLQNSTASVIENKVMPRLRQGFRQSRRRGAGTETFFSLG